MRIRHKIVFLLVLSLLVFVTGCGSDEFMPGLSKTYLETAQLPDPADRDEFDISVYGDPSGIRIFARKEHVSTAGGSTRFDGPVFLVCGSQSVSLPRADLRLQSDGSLSGHARLPSFGTGLWKKLEWLQYPADLIPVEIVKGSQLLDPDSEHCLQGGNTNRLPVLEDRAYLVYKIDLSVGGISAVIPGNPLKLFAEKLPVPGMQIYFLVDPADPSFFLTFTAKGFKALEQRFQDKALETKSKQKFKGLGKLDLLNGFGIGLSGQGLMQFRMDYTNLLDPSLNITPQFGTHLWIKGRIPIRAYGLPFILDANAGLNLNPDGVPAVDLGALDLRFRLGLNGKLFFDLAGYIRDLQKTPQMKEQNKKTIYALTALNSLITIGELAGASAVLEAGGKPTIYFSTYAGNPSVTVNLGFLAKVPGLESAGPALQDAVNGMLVPAQEQIHRFAGYFQYDSFQKDVTWYIAYQNRFTVRVKKMLGLLASLPDSVLDIDGNAPLLQADLLCKIGNRTGIDLEGTINSGFQLMDGISLRNGSRLKIKVRSPQDFLFEVSGGMGLQLWSVGASLDGMIQVSQSRVHLAGDMKIELGPLGGVYGNLSGTYYPSGPHWDLSGSGSFKILGYTVAEARIRAVDSGLWVEGVLQIPNFSSIKVRGSIDFRTGAVSLTGKADLQINGFQIAAAEVTLGTAGVSFSGSLAIPNMSSVQISGSVSSDGKFSVTARASVRILGYRLADALIDFSNAGLTIEGTMEIPGISTLSLRGSVTSSGSVSISGTGAVTVAGYRFASASFLLSNSGLRISSRVSLLGFMTIDVGGAVSVNGTFDIWGRWESARVGFSFGVGSVHGQASVSARLGNGGFSFSGSVHVDYSLGSWPFKYSDSFTLSGGITVSSSGVGFSVKFPLIGRKTFWIRQSRGRSMDGYALEPVDYKRVFPLLPAQ